MLTLLAGLAVLVAFGLYENRVAHPLLPMRLFRNPALTVGTVITAVNFFVLLGVIFFVMLYLQNVRGYSPVESGVRTLPLSLASVVAAPLGAALTGRFGARLTMPLGMLLQAGASLGILGWGLDTAYAVLWPPFVALGLGIGMVMAASSDAIVGNAPVRDAGVAGGLQSTALQVGGALGTSVLISLISSRVSATFGPELASAGVPAPVADGLAEAKDAVAMGVAPVGPRLPESLHGPVTEAAGQAFLNGVRRRLGHGLPVRGGGGGFGVGAAAPHARLCELGAGLRAQALARYSSQPLAAVASLVVHGSGSFVLISVHRRWPAAAKAVIPGAGAAAQARVRAAQLSAEAGLWPEAMSQMTQ